MTKITKYTILIFLVALQVVYLIEIIERVILNKWSDIFFPCFFLYLFGMLSIYFTERQNYKRPQVTNTNKS